MRIGPRHIPEKLYKQILRLVPLPCVDLVIVRRGRFLLGKRVNKPAKGEWWLIGGRILKGELLPRAVARHIKLETGITKLKVKKLLAARETIFRNSAQGPPAHTVNSVFLVEVGSDRVSLGDDENKKLKWFSRIDEGWPPYVKDMLRLAGFK